MGRAASGSDTPLGDLQATALQLEQFPHTQQRSGKAAASWPAQLYQASPLSSLSIPSSLHPLHPVVLSPSPQLLSLTSSPLLSLAPLRLVLFPMSLWPHPTPIPSAREALAEVLRRGPCHREHKMTQPSIRQRGCCRAEPAPSPGSSGDTQPPFPAAWDSH